VSASKNSIVGAGHGHIHPYKICKAHAFLRKLKKYLKLKNRKRKKEKIFQLTGHHYKLLYYRSIIFLTKYAYLLKPFTSNLAHTHLSTILHSHL